MITEIRIYKVKLVSGGDRHNGYGIEIKSETKSDEMTVGSLSDAINFIKTARNMTSGNKKDAVYVNFQPPCDLIIKSSYLLPYRCFPLNEQEIQEITTQVGKL